MRTASSFPRHDRPLPGSVRGLRAIRVGTHIAGFFLFPPKDRSLSPETSDSLSRWCQDLLSKFKVDVTVEGPPPGPGPFLIVANHISWMDILLIRQLLPGHFIAKEEIALWPVIGPGARRAGTFFISRNKLSSLYATLRQVCRSLERGQSVVLFPEGTTTTGENLLPFRSGLFESALRTGVPVLPVALRYESLTGPSNYATSYTGGESFGRSLWRTLGESRIRARLILRPPIFPEKKSRKVLATEARHSILSTLEEITSPQEKLQVTPGDIVRIRASPLSGLPHSVCTQSPCDGQDSHREPKT